MLQKITIRLLKGRTEVVAFQSVADVDEDEMFEVERAVNSRHGALRMHILSDDVTPAELDAAVLTALNDAESVGENVLADEIGYGATEDQQDRVVISLRRLKKSGDAFFEDGLWFSEAPSKRRSGTPA